jgi:hypothetical protein|tara:strand:- start:269 stop:529 length:261 start_codon:yes stop_codon:yes gene_type:complete
VFHVERSKPGLRVSNLISSGMIIEEYLRWLPTTLMRELRRAPVPDAERSGGLVEKGMREVGQMTNWVFAGINPPRAGYTRNPCPGS